MASWSRMAGASTVATRARDASDSSGSRGGSGSAGSTASTRALPHHCSPGASLQATTRSSSVRATLGKGTLASAWIVELTEEGHVVLIVDYEDHPGE